MNTILKTIFSPIQLPAGRKFWPNLTDYIDFLIWPLLLQGEEQIKNRPVQTQATGKQSRSLISTTARPAVGGPKTFWEDQRAGDLKKRSPTSKFTWFLRFLLSAVGGPKQILRTGPLTFQSSITSRTSTSLSGQVFSPPASSYRILIEFWGVLLFTHKAEALESGRISFLQKFN